MATFCVALPLSNGVGALICGALVQSIRFFGCISFRPYGFAAAGLLFTFRHT